MALALLLMLASGLAFEWLELERELKTQLVQWHKALGVLVLLAVILRIGIRLTHRPPPLPATIPPRERKAAHAGHMAFYFWMVALPLTGWLIVSSSSRGQPVSVFGGFDWPLIPGLIGNKELRGVVGEAHELLAYSLIVLIIGHIAAVIYHALRHENLLPRMGFGRKSIKN